MISSDVEDFFVDTVKDTIDYRVKHDVKRNDFLQLLIQLMDENQEDDVDTLATLTEGKSESKT